MKRTVTKQTITIEDESGYRFEVDATDVCDESGTRLGWKGRVVLTTEGLRTAEAVLEDLATKATWFARMTQKELAEGLK